MDEDWDVCIITTPGPVRVTTVRRHRLYVISLGSSDFGGFIAVARGTHRAKRKQRGDTGEYIQ